jgi:hypothetical protein
MLLRRVIEHVREQNWTAIGIDFAIVVVGVFVGIQVANWNAAAADRRLAERYLSGIADDVRSDTNEIRHIRDSALARIGASAYILREAGVPTLAPAIELTQSNDNGVFAGLERTPIADVEAPPAARRNRLWNVATVTYMYDSNRSAYDALLSSGKIDLIDDPRIVRALREYYYLVNALSATQARTVTPIRQKIIDVGVERGYSHWGEVDETRLIEQVRSDPALAAAIATSRELAAVHLVLLTALEQKAKELLPLLETEQP